MSRMPFIRASGSCFNSVWITGMPIFESASMASAGKKGLVTMTSGDCAMIVSGSRDISAMSCANCATLE